MYAGNTPTIWLGRWHSTEPQHRWTELHHVAIALALRCDLQPARPLDRLYRLQNSVNLPTQRRLGAG